MKKKEKKKKKVLKMEHCWQTSARKGTLLNPKVLPSEIRRQWTSAPIIILYTNRSPCWSLKIYYDGVIDHT